ncbi:unnamed protein product [Rhizophagus irregularis]|uniref:Uncharacterized protein n=1 Tax=Rhizophagus irregularis TaxID=588596 RepID=A0A2I1DYN3_9GLOM|nr:hypothetical protein RhiirB3_427087 [Rhizophagus irregularis]CAB5355933.1 unnamed protein product [Rhizophagus irregularis]
MCPVDLKSFIFRSLVFTFGIECHLFESLCQVNDIFKVFITLSDLSSLIYIIYLNCKLSVLPRRRTNLQLDVLDVLGENDNPKNPVPPVVEIVGGNGTDEITIPDIDEIEIGVAI